MTRHAPMIQTNTSHPFVIACGETLVRSSPIPGLYQRCILDKEVNYFVLQIERVGGVTHFSCGGHPNGFYLVYDIPPHLSDLLIHQHCRLERSRSFSGVHWRMSLRRRFSPTTVAHKHMVLEQVAEHWEQVLGPLYR